MADFVKMAAKLALIVSVMAAAILLLNGIVIPTINLDPIGQAVGHGKAIMDYYLTGGFEVLFTAGIMLLLIKYVLFPTFMVASIVWRWVFKVNE